MKASLANCVGFCRGNDYYGHNGQSLSDIARQHTFDSHCVFVTMQLIC